jgi:hypothetical protein
MPVDFRVRVKPERAWIAPPLCVMKNKRFECARGIAEANGDIGLRLVRKLIRNVRVSAMITPSSKSAAKIVIDRKGTRIPFVAALVPKT